MTLPAPVSVEIRFDGGPVVGSGFVDITDTVQLVSIRRGRNNVIDSYNNGTATIQLLDSTGDFNPDNSSGPYFGEILPNREVRIKAELPNPPAGVSSTRFLFTGYVESWDYKWNLGFDTAVVTIVCSDAFRLFNLAQISTVGGSAAGDTSGERIDLILDEAGWPAGKRKITGAGRKLQADPGGARSVLEVLQQVEATELGAFYIDGEGDAVFETRGEMTQKASATLFPPYLRDALPQGTIPPPLKGPLLEYQQIEVALSDELLTNEVTVTRIGGSPQTSSDTDSIDQFFKRSLSRTDTLDVDDNQALGSAKAILNNRKTIGVEIKEIGLQLLSGSNNINRAVLIDFNGLIEVQRQYSGTSSLEAFLTVQGVAHNISQGRHDLTLTTSRPLSFGFVLGGGNLMLGTLGVSTL